MIWISKDLDHWVSTDRHGSQGLDPLKCSRLRPLFGDEVTILGKVYRRLTPDGYRRLADGMAAAPLGTEDRERFKSLLKSIDKVGL